MNLKGVIVYGFSEDEAQKLKDYFNDGVSNEVRFFSADGCGEITVEEILMDDERTEFCHNDDHFLMFLGFEEYEIRKTLSDFPCCIRRPVFCTLTESNYKWKIDHLHAHLMEERNSFQGRK